MRDPKRIARVIEALRAAWLINPDLRLGQLLTAVAFAHEASSDASTSIFYTEDDVWESLLQEFSARPDTNGPVASSALSPDAARFAREFRREEWKPVFPRPCERGR
jgi:uncharacterized protein YihD (DUF1040 family)